MEAAEICFLAQSILKARQEPEPGRSIGSLSFCDAGCR